MAHIIIVEQWPREPFLTNLTSRRTSGSIIEWPPRRPRLPGPCTDTEPRAFVSPLSIWAQIRSLMLKLSYSAQMDASPRGQAPEVVILNAICSHRLRTHLR